jgi:glycosyltransferase involved in cell wall biosynthesis
MPVVSSCHGFIDSSYRAQAYQWIQRWALKRYDAVIAVSAGIAARLRDAGIADDKIHFLPNAFEQDRGSLTRDAARRFLDLPDAPVIGWVGRLSAEKGPDIAVEALARLQNSNARLLLLGDGREKEAVRARASELGVGDRILWRGAVPNAGALFAAFDAFLLSSRTEGTPMALLEAMAASVPIVATAVGGVPDVVDADSAWLVESGNSQSVARALDELLSQPAVARTRSDRAGQRLKESFGVDTWICRHESIYRGIIRAK